MTLRNRFMLLMGILLLSFAIIGMVTFSYLKKTKNITSIDNDVQTLYSASLKISNLEKDYLKWDLIDPEYFKTGQSLNITSISKQIDNSIQSCNKLLSNNTINKLEITSYLFQLKDSFEKYKKSFLMVESNKKELGFKDWGIIGKMRMAIHNVEERLNVLDISSLKVHMLMLRRHEKDYLLRRDLRYRDKFMAEMERFELTLTNASLPYKTIDEIRYLLNAYKNTFTDLIKKDLLIGSNHSNGYINDLYKYSHSIHKTSSALNDIILAKSNQYIRSINQTLLLLIVLCSFISILIGVIIIGAIQKILGGEPEHVASIVNNVANGYLKLKLQPSSSYKGMMNSVVKMTEKLREILFGILQNSEHILSTSAQFNHTSQDISQGAYNQTAAIEEMQQVIKNFTETIEQNNKNARDTKTKQSNE